MKKPFVAVASAAVLLLALVGCSTPAAVTPTASASTSSDAKLVKAAQAEGSLTWYTGDTPVANERLAAAFQAAYGIKVTPYKTVALEAQYSSERESGQVIADVISTGVPSFFADGFSKGWFIPLNDKTVPGFGAWPTAYKTPSTAIISVEPFLLAYNTDLVKPADVPKKWADLLTPANKGRLLALDPRPIPAYLAEYKVWRDKLGDDFLTKLGAAKPALIASSVPGAQALAAGEQAFLFPTSQNQVNDLISKGAPIATKVLSPTTGVQVSMSISKGAKHPNAARLFMEWILSPAGQSVLIGDTGKVSPPKVSTSKLLPKEYEQPDVTKSLAERDTILALLGLSG